MKKISLTEQFRTLEREVDAFIEEKTSEFKDFEHIYELYFLNKEELYGSIEWNVTKVSLIMNDDYRGNLRWRPEINKRASQKDIDLMTQYLADLKEYGEVFFSIEKYDKIGHTMAGLRLSKIDNDKYAFKREALAESIAKHNQNYIEHYAPKEGYVPCSYCRKQVPLDKVVKSTLIYRTRDRFGKACVAEEVRNYCSGKCAYNDQCAHEG